MKKINQFIKKESIQKSIKKKNQKAPGQISSNFNKQQLIDAINNLFLKFELAYHYQFLRIYDAQEKIDNAKILWAKSLKDYSADVIDMVADELILKSPYMPTINEMLKNCMDHKDINGLPSIRDAYNECRKSFSPRQNFKWSHPMIYHVGREVGWSKINSSDTNTFNEFKNQFYRFKKELLKGKNFKISKIVPSEEKRKKFNKNLFEELREKHKI